MSASPERRAAAMAAAAEVRKVRAEVLDGLAAGDTTLPDVLDMARSDDTVAAIKVVKVVEARPGARKVTSRQRLAALGIDQAARIGELDDGERAALVDAFGER